MWKVLLISSLISFAAKAERQGAVERAELEAQDAEECATAPGNPSRIEECREAKAARSEAFHSCLSDESIKKFEKASAVSIRAVRGQVSSQSLRNVWAGLAHSRLVKDERLPEGSGKTATDVADLLKQEGFVDLAKCKDWESRLKDPKRIPLGSVLVYGSKDHKKFDVRMKTPSGCIGHVRKTECLNLSGFKLMGVYVKNVN